MYITEDKCEAAITPGSKYSYRSAGVNCTVIKGIDDT